jgi:hypothetical protein
MDFMINKAGVKCEESYVRNGFTVIFGRINSLVSTLKDQRQANTAAEELGAFLPVSESRDDLSVTDDSDVLGFTTSVVSYVRLRLGGPLSTSELMDRYFQTMGIRKRFSHLDYIDSFPNRSEIYAVSRRARVAATTTGVFLFNSDFRRFFTNEKILVQTHLLHLNRTKPRPINQRSDTT